MSTATISLDWQRTIRLLPGYDPFAQAGDCWFDEEAAQFAVDFIESECTFTKGTKDGVPLAGQPFILEPWEKAIVGNLFGWRKNAPFFQWRYRECLLFVPRKNGKSELAAAILVLRMYAAAGHLHIFPAESGAECYGAAGKRDQTKYIFDPVKKMILANPALSHLAKIYQHSIVIGDASYLKLSSEATTEHGGSTHAAVVDELHAQPTPELVGVLETSVASRENPLLMYVTTSDYDREGSVCNDKHDYASKVRDGIINDSEFLPVIYEATPEDDWMDEAVWRAANPNYGVSLRPDHIAKQCEKARNSATYENTFKRLHLNIRTEQSFRWMQMVAWDACDGEIHIPDGAKVVIGLDGASVQDMASAVVCYDDGEQYHFQPFYFCPEEQVAQMEARGDTLYRGWVHDGLLTATPGSAIDDRAIRAVLNTLATKYDVQEVPYDPYNLTTFATQVIEEDGINMVVHRQGSVSMNEPMKLLEKLTLEKRLLHGGHPILRWNMNNLAALKDNKENIQPDKAKSAGKIDGAVGAIMSLGRIGIAIKPTSIYEERGFRCV